jgi:hypothetical protein
MDFKFTSEPRDDTYRRLVEFARSIGCDRGLLVERQNLPMSHGLRGVLTKLSAWLMSERHSREWPGTVLFGHEAVVRTYRLCPESIETLCSMVDGLYDWIHPESLEDLCLIRSDGRVLLTTISHERVALMSLDQADYAALPSELTPILRECAE